MNQARLTMLARRYAPEIQVVDTVVKSNETTLHLACGHTGHCAPHFSPSTIKTWHCAECGQDQVRKIFPEEFQA